MTAEDFMADGKWNCTKCGSCCRLVGRIKELKHLNRGAGACINLTGDNLCSIYETRPIDCHADHIPGTAIGLAEACARIANAIEEERTCLDLSWREPHSLPLAELPRWEQGQSPLRALPLLPLVLALLPVVVL